MDRGPKIYRSSSSTNHSKLVYFCLFILVNAFLAYVKSPIEVKLWVGLFGLGTPLLIATRATPAATKMGNPWQGESFSIPSNLILLFILFSAAFVRLYKMNSLSVWPMWDEGHYASLAINLEEDWRFQFFFGSQQYMPVYTWIQALFFRPLDHPF